MTTVKNIYDYINTIAPFDTQEDWDNSGFLVGDFRGEVKKVVLSLDTTKETVDFAKSVDADLIISHHPVIFGGVKNVKKDSVLYELVINNIAQISVHTPYDKACGGINDNLADIFGLKAVRKLDNGYLVVGELEEAMSIDDFASYAGDLLGSNGLRYTDTDKLIKTVAVGGGACSEFIDDAIENADCFLTGDLKYHEMLDAQQLGYPVISAGHFETENKPFLMMKDKLKSIFTDVEFIIAPTQNPVLSI
ncbi:MAG: Nif3-like dinuclear metal center hexameric protein [Acetobacter sp.]|nr:Nif3-like dinuclear metal center hexameric protein [Bacteroides sp.]MCM1342082.1 Nif3-like dinuclear metal center hexameric protein [Acetobacter sp.]MCM1434309.1 Nif3-like dinuclear metal center hexameric protein [Clostridiales bacterium]